MRILILTISILLSGFACLRAQTTKSELFLKPEDVGAHKYVWQVTPQHDEIVVFYLEEWSGDKLLRKEEQLRGAETEGKLCALQVLYVDGGFFDYLATGGTSKPSFGALQYPGGAGRLDNYELVTSQHSQLNPGSVTLSFVSRDKPGKESKKYIYNVYVVPYEVLKQRYPDVPPLAELRTGGWASHTKP